MQPYFDPTDVRDLALLPPQFRGADDLANVASDVEAEVINHYTRRAHDARYTLLQPVAQPPIGFSTTPSFVYTPRGYATDLGNGTLVYLVGYTVDAADTACDPMLKAALKRAIARAIAWRLRQWDRDPTVRTEASPQGQVTRTFREDAVNPFPPEFESSLSKFDSRPAVWAL